MDYYNEIDPYGQESVPYQPRQAHASGQRQYQYMEQPIPERNRMAIPPRMPKSEAVALVQQFKKGLVVASIVGFAVLSALVVGHTTGVTSSVQQQPDDNTFQQPDQSQDHGGFFQQQQQGQGGYGFGSNGNQQPVSGSRTS